LKCLICLIYFRYFFLSVFLFYLFYSIFIFLYFFIYFVNFIITFLSFFCLPISLLLFFLSSASLFHYYSSFFSFFYLSILLLLFVFLSFLSFFLSHLQYFFCLPYYVEPMADWACSSPRRTPFLKEIAPPPPPLHSFIGQGRGGGGPCLQQYRQERNTQKKNPKNFIRKTVTEKYFSWGPPIREKAGETLHFPKLETFHRESPRKWTKCLTQSVTFWGIFD
jgi:hypothetical protein